jgi:hypothetical protein
MAFWANVAADQAFHSVTTHRLVFGKNFLPMTYID